jgi:hypothetical protein
MALEALELVCGCCEICLSIADLASSKKETREERAEKAPQTARLMRKMREEKRGVRLTFAKNRIVEIDFLSGPAAGKLASRMPEMELKRLALAMPHRTARFAIRRYLRHRKAGRVPPPEDVVVRR